MAPSPPSVCVRVSLCASGGFLETAVFIDNAWQKIAKFLGNTETWTTLQTFMEQENRAISSQPKPGAAHSLAMEYIAVV